jgi:predicted metalloprotease with PDZ domain
MMSADDAWRRLYEGAALGRDADGSLSSETQRMPYAGNYRTVYWAGAAIALMVDVELRKRSQGKESLDGALATISQRADIMSKPATADSLLEQLDSAVGGHVCSGVAQRYVTGRALPDLADLYRQLGLLGASAPSPTSEPVQLQQHADAPLGWIRDAIMSVHEEQAQRPLSGG